MDTAVSQSRTASGEVGPRTKRMMISEVEVVLKEAMIARLVVNQWHLVLVVLVVLVAAVK
jgi:hypothetical protein